jgi:hypothetical protein
MNISGQLLGSYSFVKIKCHVNGTSASSTLMGYFNSDNGTLGGVTANYAMAILQGATLQNRVSQRNLTFQQNAQVGNRTLELNIYNANSRGLVTGEWEGGISTTSVATAPIIYQGHFSWYNGTQINGVQEVTLRLFPYTATMSSGTWCMVQGERHN